MWGTGKSSCLKRQMESIWAGDNRRRPWTTGWSLRFFLTQAIVWHVCWQNEPARGLSWTPSKGRCATELRRLSRELRGQQSPQELQRRTDSFDWLPDVWINGQEKSCSGALARRLLWGTVAVLSAQVWSKNNALLDTQPARQEHSWCSKPFLDQFYKAEYLIHNECSISSNTNTLQGAGC